MPFDAEDRPPSTRAARSLHDRQDAALLMPSFHATGQPESGLLLFVQPGGAGRHARRRKVLTSSGCSSEPVSDLSGIDVTATVTRDDSGPANGGPRNCVWRCA